MIRMNIYINIICIAVFCTVAITSVYIICRNTVYFTGINVNGKDSSVVKSKKRSGRSLPSTWKQVLAEKTKFEGVCLISVTNLTKLKAFKSTCIVISASLLKELNLNLFERTTDLKLCPSSAV